MAKKYSRLARWLLIGLSAVGLYFLTQILDYAWFWVSCNQTTDIKKYHYVIWHLPSGVGSHFPGSVSSDPNRARLRYHELLGWGQGGSWDTELWMKLQPEETDQLYAKFDKMKKATYQPHLEYNTFYHWVDPSSSKELFHFQLYFLPDTWRDPEETSASPPSLDFVVFTLDNQTAPAFQRGVAISKKRNEIIYFANFSYAM